MAIKPLTPSRALEVFCGGSKDVDEVLEANLAAISALKLRIRQKPRMRKYFHPVCPNCETAFMDGGTPKHCPECGQALLWESEGGGAEG